MSHASVLVWMWVLAIVGEGGGAQTSRFAKVWQTVGSRSRGGGETHVGSECCCLRGAEGKEKSKGIGGSRGEDILKGALETGVPVEGGAVKGKGGGTEREGAGTVCSNAPAHKVGEFCPQALPRFLRSLVLG